MNTTNSESNKLSKSGSLKVIKTCRLLGKLNITVRLYKTPVLAQYKSEPKLSLSSSAETLLNIGNKPKTVFVDIKDLKPAHPNDFIEPIHNLAIPNTQEYMKHTNGNEDLEFSQHQPVIPKGYSMKIGAKTRSNTIHARQNGFKPNGLTPYKAKIKNKHEAKKNYLI